MVARWALLACACGLAACAARPPAAAADVRQVVDGFRAALAAGDLERVEALLDPQVLVLEAGGAERSREEYFAHHARADADFLAKAEVVAADPVVHVEGDLAWTGRVAEVRFERDGEPVVLDSAESMVLRRGPEGWRIVHIHWSSRPRK